MLKIKIISIYPIVKLSTDEFFGEDVGGSVALEVLSQLALLVEVLE